MLVSKKSIIGFLALGISMPMIAFAASDLTIHNLTHRDSTSIINNGLCSKDIPGGVTRAGTTNVVGSKTLFFACVTNKENCKAVVYMTDNCKGDTIGTVIFSTATGVKEFQPNPSSTEGYIVSYNGFEFTIDGGPQSF